MVMTQAMPGMFAGSGGFGGDNNSWLAFLMMAMFRNGGLFNNAVAAEAGINPAQSAWVMQNLGDIKAGVANCSTQADVLTLSNTMLMQFNAQNISNLKSFDTLGREIDGVKCSIGTLGGKLSNDITASTSIITNALKDQEIGNLREELLLQKLGRRADNDSNHTTITMIQNQNQQQQQFQSLNEKFDRFFTGGQFSNATNKSVVIGTGNTAGQSATSQGPTNVF